MKLLVSGATATLRRLDDARLGQLLRPGNGNLPSALPGRPWAIDNGAFAGFDEDAFEALLARVERWRSECLWVACPDVVADAAATLRLFERWGPDLAARGYRVALVAQDGLALDDVPWPLLDALFIGGSTAWKCGPEAWRLGLAAKRHGKALHVGRVNSLRRMRIARAMNADSIDGTSFSMFPDRWIPRALAWLSDLECQKELFQ